MAIYRQIHISYWQDPFVLTLTPEEKYFYIYLMTNSKTSQCGVYELPKQVMVFETGYNLETIDKLIKKFVDYRKIDYSEETKEIYIKNWLKYNSSKSPKVRQCIDEEVSKIKCSLFKRKTMDSLSIDLGEEEEKEQEEEQEKKEEQKEVGRTSKKFTPPTLEEVNAYCLERKNNINPQQWIDHYISNGWMVGKTKMKDWKAAVRTWERNDYGGNNGRTEKFKEHLNNDPISIGSLVIRAEDPEGNDSNLPGLRPDSGTG